MKDVYVMSLILTICQLSFVVVPSETVTFGLPQKRPVSSATTNDREDFKYLWMSSDGIFYHEPGPMRLEIAATQAITELEQETGANIVKRVTWNMPPEVFANLTSKASVGLFTWKDKTTVFPEYADLKDRPECKGSCEGSCSNTCSSDGRKYDAFEGMGGTRATCVNDNFMCAKDDRFQSQYSVLVHEFGHTIHHSGLTEKSPYYDKIHAAYKNARENNIWDLGSYAMSREYEYFATATAVFFNADKLNVLRSATEMSSCGHPDGRTCADEKEARSWLERKDPKLFEVLSYTYTNLRPTIPGRLGPCTKAGEIFSVVVRAT